jgi:hypothetical protein
VPPIDPQILIALAVGLMLLLGFAGLVVVGIVLLVMRQQKPSGDGIAVPELEEELHLRLKRDLRRKIDDFAQDFVARTSEPQAPVESDE